MRPQRSGFPVGGGHPPPGLGIAVAIAAIALITALLYPLREIAPAVSLGVVYLLGVLLVATFFGLRLGLLTAVASAAAFNWFHIAPTGRFTIAKADDWVALLVFLTVAAAASSVAELARRRAAEADERRREADLAAELTRLLLGGADLGDATTQAAERIAAALGVQAAALELASPDAEPAAPRTQRGNAGAEPTHPATAREPLAGASGISFALGDAAAPLGRLLLPADLPADARNRVRERVVPALEAILTAAVSREALQREVVETAALRRSDVLKTTLLRSVSHDLRTPLTGMVAAGEALASPSLTDEERRELASVVGTEGHRLARLVDDLLDVSRLQAGAIEPHRDWCSVEELLRTAVEEHPAGPAAFSLSIDHDLPLVRADAVQLERAFANLLDNAVRHSGGHPVSVRSRAVGQRLVVRIVDRGVGIPHAELDRVFAPFHRGGGEAAGGVGLGLAIVRGFVELNGGRVRAESLPGQGTSLVVELPLEPQPSPTAAAR
jgi:two-component system, OmpR family, sensor histidine kinase KdpD